MNDWPVKWDDTPTIEPMRSRRTTNHPVKSGDKRSTIARKRAIRVKRVVTGEGRGRLRK